MPCRLWDAGSGDCLEHMPGHEGPIWSMHFDGARVASCDDEGSVRLWDLDTHRQAGGAIPRAQHTQTSSLHRCCLSAGCCRPGRMPAPLSSVPLPPPRRVGVSAALAPCSLKCVAMDGRQMVAAGESGLLGLWSLERIQQALQVRQAGGLVGRCKQPGGRGSAWWVFGWGSTHVRTSFLPSTGCRGCRHERRGQHQRCGRRV